MEGDRPAAPPPAAGVPALQPGRKDSTAVDLALASEVFDHFMSASTLKAILRAFRFLCETVRVKPGPMPMFYPRLKAKLRSWKAQALWAKFDKRAAFKVYKGGRACAGQRVLVIGCGPCGLRTAIEAQLLGARVVVVEKRDRFSRNNVLHLWPYNISDLRGLGAKKFYGKFCAGAIDHISIRQLQCILLKAALLLGVEVFESVGFEALREPEDIETGWRMHTSPADHPVSHYEFDVLVAADGKRNTLDGFKRKEFRGKLAIAITANFINKHTEAESRVEEISGVAFIFNQKFFNDMSEQTGVSLENIVYYKDETHYFVMTAKKPSLLQKGVLLRNEPDTVKLLSQDNINQDALFQYAREAADFSTKYTLPDLDFAVNHYGKPDVAMFDFTSMFQADNSCRVVERHGHRLLAALVGDSLLEPFWPMGTGCPRGFFGGLDLCWLMRSLALGKQTLLEALAERESIYRLLAQTTTENTCKDYSSYTVDPCSRYPTLNKRLVTPCQVKHLVDTDNPAMLEEELALIAANGTAQSAAFAAAGPAAESYKQRQTTKRNRRESHVSPDALLTWFQKQLSNVECVSVNDMTYSFQDGLALCAVIYRFRPDLVEFQALDPAAWAENNQMAFDLLEQELGILPIMAGTELAASKCPDKLTMIAYLSQVYEAFRKEIPVLKNGSSKLDASDEDLLDLQFRHNHGKSKGVRRKINGAAAGGQGKKKRRSKDPGEPPSPDASLVLLDDPVTANNKENIQETMRMNRSANKKRLEQMIKRADDGKDKLTKIERKSIKKEERYRIIEEQFGGGGKRRSGEGGSKYRESKKPKELKRAIGKINKNDWNIKNIEETLNFKTGEEKGASSKEKKVPKWSKDAFQDKFNIMKGKLDGAETPTKGKDRLADIDTSLARLQKKLREGSAMETGQRGANKVSALAEELFPEDGSSGAAAVDGAAAAVVEPTPKKDYNAASSKGSETCHFCEKRVYVVERMSSEGKFFHRSCFRCGYCNVLLRLGSYVYHREGTFGGKFFCIPHSTENALEKYRYRKKTDELQDVAKRAQEHTVNHEWDKSETGALDHLKSLPDRHRERLLNSLEHDRRGSTPERVEFEVSVDLHSEEEVASIMDEDEWTDRNFGNSFQAGDGKNGKKLKKKKSKGSNDVGVESKEDTSEDSVSDLDTDTSEEDELLGPGGDGPESRPLTADETRRLQREWIKKYDPGSDEDSEEEEGVGERSRYDNVTTRRRRRQISASSVDSSEYDEDDDEEDYDGEYESDTSSEDDDSDSQPESSDLRLAVPPPPPQRRHHNVRERFSQRGATAGATSDTTTTDTSTEVGSEDLSSAEDSSDSESEFTSGTATECEFTDSEGRPNPFHKQLVPPKVTVEPASPDPRHRTVVIPERPRAPAPVTSKTAEAEKNAQPAEPAKTMTYATQYQYKTPNVSGRLQSEQHRQATTTNKFQDFGTRRALNLKKNWVSEAPTNVGTSKRPEEAKAEIDSRLKSLMDRLSNQQKLLKPADKPSSQMQHFLDTTGKAGGSSGATQSTVRSPPTVTSPPFTVTSPPFSTTSATISQQQKPMRYYNSAPTAYKSAEASPAVASNNAEAELNTDESKSEDVKRSKPAYEEVESIVVPKLVVKEEEEDEEASTDDDESSQDSQEELEKVKSLEPPLDDKKNTSFGSSGKDEEFESCNEEGDDAVKEEEEEEAFVEAINPLVQSQHNDMTENTTASFATPGNSDFNAESAEVTPATPKAAPLATSSPMVGGQIDFIDEEEEPAEEEEEEMEEPPRPPPPVPEPELEPEPMKEMSPPPVPYGDEFTHAYKERDPSCRVAQLADARQREKSVVHDMLLARVSNSARMRSSSAARRANRTKLPLTNMPPPIPTDQEKATTPKVIRRPITYKAKPNPFRTEPPKQEAAKAIAEMDFPLIDDEDAASSAPASSNNTPVKKMFLPATPLTNPEKFGIPSKATAATPVSRTSRPPARLESMPPMRRSHTTLGAPAYLSKKPNPSSAAPLASPTHSTVSNDLDYMDGIVSSTDELSSPSAKSSTSKSGKEGKKTFMKAISGIFSRSSSMSSVARQQSVPPPEASTSSTTVPNSQVNTASKSNNNVNSAEKAQQPQGHLRFPRLNFRSSSVSRVASKDKLRSPTSSEAPRADISELGSLNSLSTSASTPRKEPASGLFRTTSLQMATSHPSTPPVPLSRKITFSATGGNGDSLSENEENESPDASLNSSSSSKKLVGATHAETVSQLPPELLEKIMRKGKGAKRAARVAEVKRVRKAQEIQRNLEELDVQHKDLEERGIRAERSIRGEDKSKSPVAAGTKSEAEMMQSWFSLLTEKNRLVRREQELLVQAKHLELEDRSARLEAELREHLALDARSGESVVREGEILKELLEISEQREKLQAMLERDQARYAKEDQDIEAQMKAQGLRVVGAAGAATGATQRILAHS